MRAKLFIAILGLLLLTFGIVLTYQLISDAVASFTIQPEPPRYFIRDFSWSPDGRQLKFTFNAWETWNCGLAESYVVDADGKNLQVLESGESFEWPTGEGGQIQEPLIPEEKGRGDRCEIPRPTLDATTILTPTPIPTPRDIVVVDGMDPNLLYSVDDVEDITWSPDDCYVAFHMKHNGDAKIHILDVSNGQLDQILEIGGWHGQPLWSPHGRYFAFSTRNEDSGMYIYDAESREVILLKEDVGVSDYEWSPDGHSILFDTYQGGGGPNHFIGSLYLADPEDQNVQTLLTDVNVNEVVWSPVDRKLAVATGPSHNDKEIYVIDLDTGGVTKIFPKKETPSLKARAEEKCYPNRRSVFTLGLTHDQAYKLNGLFVSSGLLLLVPHLWLKRKNPFFKALLIFVVLLLLMFSFCLFYSDVI